MKAIAVFTASGTTARLISKYRPKCEIFGFASHEHVCNRLNLYWGVRSISCEPVPMTEAMVNVAERHLTSMGVVQPGDIVGIVAGTQRSSGSTNFMRLHVIGTSEGNYSKLPAGDRRHAPRYKPTTERRKR